METFILGLSAGFCPNVLPLVVHRTGQPTTVHLVRSEQACYPRPATSRRGSRGGSVRYSSYKGHGRRPEYGDLVRPLPRTWKGRRIPATPPDRVETWTEDGMEFRAEFWDNLVLPDVKMF